MDDFTAFIRRYAVLSKTSDQLHAARYGDTVYVFALGYPMTYASFCRAMMKALLPTAYHCKQEKWYDLIDEVIKLSEGLATSLDRESDLMTVPTEICRVFGKKSDGYSADQVYTTMLELDAQVQDLL